MILKILFQNSYRELSTRIAESELCRWLIHLPAEGAIRVPSKSALQDYADRLPHDERRLVVDGLLSSALTPNEAGHTASKTVNVKIFRATAS